LDESTASHGALVRQNLAVGSTEADPEHARELIDFASSRSGNRAHLKEVYGHLIDLMTNTHEHASRRQGTEKWWASVYVDHSRGCDCFTFIDMGVGIFGSVVLQLRLQLMKFVGKLSREETLRLLLSRKIPSSTGKPYRGRGLPSIYEALKVERSISRLLIATNDLHADLGEERYMNLSAHFHGLLLYWEVSWQQTTE
jgi:hypothetical protein